MTHSLKFPQQLLLDLDIAGPQTFNNFIVGQNKHIVELLQSLHPLEQTYGHSIFCWAEEGCGKSHLLHAYCSYWQEEGVQPTYFNGENLPNREQLYNYASMTVVVFDNVQALIGHSEREEDLLYLLQKCYDKDIPLLLSAHQPPQTLNCRLEDLATRLASFFVFRIRPLNEELAMEFITYEAKRLGLHLSEHIRERIHQLYIPGEMRFLVQLLKRLAVMSEPSISIKELEREWHLLTH